MVIVSTATVSMVSYGKFTKLVNYAVGSIRVLVIVMSFNSKLKLTTKIIGYTGNDITFSALCSCCGCFTVLVNRGRKAITSENAAANASDVTGVVFSAHRYAN